MNLLELYESIKNFVIQDEATVIIVIICVMSLIQIVPIKCNPWTAFAKLLRFIGHLFTGDLVSKLDEITKKVDNLSDKVDDNEVDRIRWEIRSFADSCRRKDTPHTQDDFLHIFKINKKYHSILEEIHKENGEIDGYMKYLNKLYQEMLENDAFLK